MVYLSGVNNQGVNFSRRLPFYGEEKTSERVKEQEESAKLLYREKKEHPVLTTLQIEGDKLKNAFWNYPRKGFEGSKNANFYEFLTMGTVPYLVGSASMIGIFNGASRFFDEEAAESARKLGKKIGLGVLFYGVAKNISRKFIEEPVNYKYGIDINLPYKKRIEELPEKRNVEVLHNEKIENISPDTESEKDKAGNLIAYEYHKAFESADFPRWDLFYDNKDFGKDRNSYFNEVGKKMGFSDKDLEYSDQKVKPLIKEKIVQTNAFATLSSYLWAATGVGLAMQEHWEGFLIDPVKRFKDWKDGTKNSSIVKDFAVNLYKSFKDFVGTDKNGPIDYIVNKCKHQTVDTVKKPLTRHIAGRALLGSAVITTLAGNFITLNDFNKSKGAAPAASASLIDDSKEKVVC